MKLLTTLLLCFLLRSASGQTDSSLVHNGSSGIWVGQSDGKGHIFAEKEMCDTCKWKVLDGEALMKYYEDQIAEEQGKFLKLAGLYNSLLKDYNRLRKMFTDHLVDDRNLLEDLNKKMDAIRKLKQ